MQRPGCPCGVHCMSRSKRRRGAKAHALSLVAVLGSAPDLPQLTWQIITDGDGRRCAESQSHSKLVQTQASRADLILTRDLSHGRSCLDHASCLVSAAGQTCRLQALALLHWNHLRHAAFARRTAGWLAEPALALQAARHHQQPLESAKLRHPSGSDQAISRGAVCGGPCAMCAGTPSALQTEVVGVGIYKPRT
jgi:hypothetical protein